MGPRADRRPVTFRIVRSGRELDSGSGPFGARRDLTTIVRQFPPALQLAHRIGPALLEQDVEQRRRERVDVLGRAQPHRTGSSPDAGGHAQLELVADARLDALRFLGAVPSSVARTRSPVGGDRLGDRRRSCSWTSRRSLRSTGRERGRQGREEEQHQHHGDQPPGGHAQPRLTRWLGASPHPGRMFTPDRAKGRIPGKPDRGSDECQCLGAKGKPVARRGRKVTGLPSWRWPGCHRGPNNFRWPNG